MEKERAQPSIPVIILALQQQHSGSIGCWLLYNMTKGPAPRYDNYYVRTSIDINIAAAAELHFVAQVCKALGLSFAHTRDPLKVAAVLIPPRGLRSATK